MKKKFILIATFVGLLMSGCSDSFLDEVAKDKTYADNLYTDLNGFNASKHALLNMVREERGEAILSIEFGMMWKIGTDVAWANSEFSWSRGLNRYTEADLNSTMQFLNGESTDPSAHPGVFLVMYRCINAANMLIDRAENKSVNWGGATPADNEKHKNEVVAHARLIRAWCYRHLVMTFGAVPISEHEITGSSYRDDWEREPVEKVQALIEQDLLFAEKYLPEKADNVTTLSKVVAQHFLTELYLWENRNEDAVAKGKAAVSNPNYKLITARYGVNKNQPGCAFMDQFLDGNILTSEGNTEALWILPNTTLDNTNGRIPCGAHGCRNTTSWV